LASTQAVPEVQPGPVHITVGSTVRKDVFGGYRSVFLEVYAPWCGHCKEFEPTYKQFAVRMAKEELNVLVAKIDGEANDIPFGGFEYEGFPALFYLSPESNEPELVSARSMADLMAFVKKKEIGKLPPAPGSPEAIKANLEEIMEKFKSEKVPENQTWPVKTAVFRNLVSEILLQEVKDTILFVLAPWCPHSKALLPSFETYAEKIIGSAAGEKIDVWKMDHIANDLPLQGYEVKGYPTIFYIKAGQKSPEKTFTGTTCVKKLKEYVSSMADVAK